MSKQAKSLFIVIPICFILAGLTVFLCFLDPDFEANLYKISSMIILTLWTFFITPSLLFAIVWVKDYFNGMSFEQSFRIGYLLGCSWGVFVFLLLLLASPVIGIVWFVQTIKELKLSLKSKREQSNNSTDENDIFHL